MRSYAKVTPRFWQAGTGRRLRGDTPAQVLALYLMSCAPGTMSGIFRVSIATMASDTGLPLEQVERAMLRLEKEEFVRFDPSEDLVWLVSGALHQVGAGLAERDARVAHIRRELEDLRGHKFAAAWVERYGKAFHVGSPPAPASHPPLEPPLRGPQGPLEGPSRPPQGHYQDQDLSQDQDQDQDHRQEQYFPPAPAIPVPPSTQLVLAAPSKPARTPDPGHAAGKSPGPFDEIIRLFADTWRASYGEDYLVTPQDRSNLGRLLRSLPNAEAIRLYPWRQAFGNYLADPSKFVAEQMRHSLSWFCTNGGLNKYRTEAATVGYSDKEIRGMQSSALYRDMVAQFKAREVSRAG